MLILDVLTAKISPMQPIFAPVSVSLPPLPSSTLFPLLSPPSLPPSLPPERPSPSCRPSAYVGLRHALPGGILPPSLPPSGPQRGFASDRPLATIWYRSSTSLPPSLWPPERPSPSCRPSAYVGLRHALPGRHSPSLPLTSREASPLTGLWQPSGIDQQRW